MTDNATSLPLFPLHGVTHGLTGLILSAPNHTPMVCGDAIPRLESRERSFYETWDI